MQGLFTLLTLSILMALSSFLAGMLPLSFSLSPGQLRLISTVGMGVLVGTSLVVIIPEGVETIYNANVGEYGHVRRALQFRHVDSQWTNVRRGTIEARNEAEVDAFLATGLIRSDEAEAPPTTPTTPESIGIMEHGPDEQQQGGGDELKEKPDNGSAGTHSRESSHAWIGVALISGFILMFMVDKLPQSTMPAKPNQQTYHISLNDLGRGLYRAPTATHDGENGGFTGSTRSRSRQGRGYATTTGLVIHAAADGIALGASSSTSDTATSFVIFFAIMVHKAPAAFGLTSVLLKQGLSKRSARTHLLLFSLAAPTGALLTWLFALFLGAGRFGNEENTKWCTGMLLLFSGGTFLYVAMHTMQDVGSSHRETHTNGNIHGFGNQDVQVQDEKPSLKDLMAAVFGMVLPLFLQIGHAH